MESIVHKFTDATGLFCFFVFGSLYVSFGFKTANDCNAKSKPQTKWDTNEMTQFFSIGAAYRMSHDEIKIEREREGDLVELYFLYHMHFLSISLSNKLARYRKKKDIPIVCSHARNQYNSYTHNNKKRTNGR